MLLASKLTIQVKSGFLPHLINEIYKRNCSVRNVSMVGNKPDSDLFNLEILYSNFDKYNGLINKITKYEDSFQILSSVIEMEKEIAGGLLSVSGKMKIDDLTDYEMNVAGATELIIKMLQEGKDIHKYSGISKNVGIFCCINENNSEKDYLKSYAYAERDSVIINRFTGLNAFPVLIRTSQPDDFIKILNGIQPTFTAVRISSLGNVEDIFLYEHIYNNLFLPVLSKDHDEIPLYLLLVISHILDKNNIKTADCGVGIIGINISSLRLARLLRKLGFPRLLGSDANVQLMHNFEKEGGLATINENIINNSDLIIIFKNQMDTDELKNLGSGQILISVLEENIDTDLIREKGIRDFYQGIGNAALFPGLLNGLIGSGIKFLDDEMLIRLSGKIIELKEKGEVIPDVFSEAHQRIPRLLSEL